MAEHKTLFTCVDLTMARVYCQQPIGRTFLLKIHFVIHFVQVIRISGTCIENNVFVLPCGIIIYLSPCLKLLLQKTPSYSVSHPD